MQFLSVSDLDAGIENPLYRTWELQYQLRNSKKGDKSVFEFLLLIKVIVDALYSIRHPVSEHEQLDVILEGLPSEYELLVLLMTTKPDLFSFSKIGSLLVAQEARIERNKQTEIVSLNLTQATASKQPDASSSSVVQYTQSKLNSANSCHNQSYNNYQCGDYGFCGCGGGQRGGCRHCGAHGGNSNVQCQVCSKFGHIAAYCHYRFDSSCMPQQNIYQPNQFATGHQQFPNSPATYTAPPGFHLQRNYTQFGPPQSQAHQITYIAPTLSTVAAPSMTQYSVASMTYQTSFPLEYLAHDRPKTGLWTRMLLTMSPLMVKISRILLQSKGMKIFSLQMVKVCLSSPLVQLNFSLPLVLMLLFISNLLHVPSITKNLVSVSTFAKDNNAYFEFHPTLCFVKSQVDHSVLLEGFLGSDGLYQFPSLPLSSCLHSNQSNSAHCVSTPVQVLKTTHTVPTHTSTSGSLWPNRLGHPNFSVLSHVLKLCKKPTSNKMSTDLSVACCMGKSHKLPSQPSFTDYEPLQLIFLDLWGPSPISCYQYYVSFTDAHSDILGFTFLNKSLIHLPFLNSLRLWLSFN